MVQLSFSRMLGYLWKHHTNPFTGYAQHSPDKYPVRRRVKMMTAHFYGRGRNCYRIASRYLLRSLTNTTINRKVRRRDFKETCEQRIEAGAAEHNFDAWYFQEGLKRSHIQLNRKVLANLAIWEPRTFRSVVAVVANKSMQSPQSGGLGLPHCGPSTEVITRGKL